MKHAPFYRHDAQATRFKRTRTGAGGPRPPCRPRTKGGRLGSRRSTPAPGRRAHSSCAVGSIARSTLALLTTPFAGRSPFTAFILGCELSLQPCLVVQRMIAPFEQNVLLEVLRREPALMCPCCSTLSTHTTHHSLSRSCLTHGMGDSLPKHACSRANTDTDRVQRHARSQRDRQADRAQAHTLERTGQLRKRPSLTSLGECGLPARAADAK